MAIQRVEVGTASAKTSGTTLTYSSVTIPVNDGIEVAVAYDQSQGLPTVTWGGATLERLRSTSSATSGLGIAIFSKPQIRNERTVDIVATWSGSIGARVMAITRVRGATIEDVGSNNTYDTASTLVNTGFTGLPNYGNAYASAYWAADVAVENFAGAPDTGAAYEYLEGQLVGTTGGGLDITMREGYLDMPTAIDTRARLLNAVSALWVCSVVVLRQHTMNSQGITPTDEAATDAKFAASALDIYDKVYAFNEALDRYEVFNVARADLPSPIANSENGWI